MWNPFKKSKAEETKFEYRVIDWTKVTTVEDVVNILSNIGLTHRVKVCKSNGNLRILVADRIS